MLGLGLQLSKHNAIFGGFSPASIPGLQLWLDASQIVGLNDGDAVATWSDLSSAANNAVQATASKRPTYQTGEINGLPAVSSDGVDDILDLSVSVSANAFTVFVVGRKNAGSAVSFLGLAGTAGASAPLYYGPDTNFYTQDQANLFRSTAGQNSTLETNFCYTGYTTGGGPQHRLNRSLLGGSSGASGSPTAFVGIGGSTGIGYGGQLIGELLCYDHPLTADEITAVETCLTAKWATP